MDTLFVAFAEKDNIYNYEMLSLELLMASLKQQGLASHFIQVEFEYGTELSNEYLEQCSQDIPWERIGLVGISPIYLYTEQINQVIHFIKSKYPKVKIALGGAMAVEHLSNQMFQIFPNADILSIGEGERTIVDLVKCIQLGSDLSKCAGIVFRSHDEIVCGPPRDDIQNLDEVSWADRLMLVKNKSTVAYLQTARGCEGNCTFCSESRIFSAHRGHKKRWRGRSAKNVVDEIEQIVNQYKVRIFSFVDNSFEDPLCGGEKRITELAQEIIDRKIEVYFRTLMRAESIQRLRHATLEKLKQAGMYHVLIGVESAYPPTLKLFGKRADVQDNIRSIHTIDELHIDFSLGFIPYHPYTTLEEVQANLEFFHTSNMEIKFYDVLDNQLKLFQNTPLFDKVKRDNLLTDQFSMLNPYGYNFADPKMKVLCDASVNMMEYLYQHSNLHKYIELVKMIKFVLFKAKSDGTVQIEEVWHELRAIENNVGIRVMEVYENMVGNFITHGEHMSPASDKELQELHMRIIEGTRLLTKIMKKLYAYL